MDQVHVVRHKVLVEGQAVRRVAREMGIARNTVRKYLAQAEPVRVEREPRARPVREKVVPRIEALLEESPRWTGGKQRLTAARLHTMLVVEGFEVGQTTVKAAVAEWKRKRREVFVPLVYPAGDLAEVDFFEVLVELTGAMVKAWMFVMRLMHSGRDFAWLYLRQDQPSFLDGHVRAFEHFGCVPQGMTPTVSGSRVASIAATTGGPASPMGGGSALASGDPTAASADQGRTQRPEESIPRAAERSLVHRDAPSRVQLVPSRIQHAPSCMGLAPSRP
jgi:transposase